MKYLSCVPAYMLELFSKYEEISNSSKDPKQWKYLKTFQFEYDLWQRLATRPEMESVWILLANAMPSQHIASLNEIIANGGLVARANHAIRCFNTSAHLSPVNYKKEMVEISLLAKTLSNKLKKFCASASASTNKPFTYGSLLSSDQMQHVMGIVESNELHFNEQNFNFRLDHYFPPMDELLKQLSAVAEQESKDQTHRLKLPKKINDETLFRTYFVRVMGDFFYEYCANYSPSMLSIFCRCALDDPNITPDLVRRLYTIGDEDRLMLMLYHSHLKQDD
jgi:hypothetical protein